MYIYSTCSLRNSHIRCADEFGFRNKKIYIYVQVNSIYNQIIIQKNLRIPEFIDCNEDRNAIVASILNLPAQIASPLSKKIQILKRQQETKSNIKGLLLKKMKQKITKELGKNKENGGKMRYETSEVYWAGSGAPATTVGPPPCIFRARTVATMTTAEGMRPLCLQGTSNHNL